MALMSLHSNSLHGQKPENARLWRRVPAEKARLMYLSLIDDAFP